MKFFMFWKLVFLGDLLDLQLNGKHYIFILEDVLNFIFLKKFFILSVITLLKLVIHHSLSLILLLFKTNLERTKSVEINSSKIKIAIKFLLLQMTKGFLFLFLLIKVIFMILNLLIIILKIFLFWLIIKNNSIFIGS